MRPCVLKSRNKAEAIAFPCRRDGEPATHSSELTADEEALIIEATDKHWDELNRMIDDVFAGKKIQIKRIK